MNNGEVGGSWGRGRGWQQPDSQPPQLRRPRIITEEVKTEAPISNLSAEAKEWYPPNYTPQAYPVYAPEATQYRPQRFSVQDRLRQAQNINPYTFNDMSYSLEEAESMDMRENIANLITVMCEITFDPGKFDTLCGPLLDSFATTLHDVNYARPLVDAIVNQSIGEPNFRYNGARLCSMYDSVGSPDETKFRECLLERCSVDENKIITGIETSEETMRGFAMFLAELYTQLEDSQGGRIRSLGESLCKVLLHLLNTENETNIKAVCQLLKLSGLALEADCPSHMQTAMDWLRARSHMPSVRAVLALRAKRWGLADPATTHHMHANGSPESVEGGYLADGHALTAEESAFLQSNLPPGKLAALDEDILEELENDAWDTGMDAEMRAGFLEFLEISNQIKR